MDSIWATITPIRDSTSWALTHELLEVLGQTVALYPNDPQVHYRLGEIRYHYGWIAGVSVDETIESFATAVALDSGFTMAYPHLPKLYSRAGDVGGVRTTATAYLALVRTVLQANVARLTHGLLKEQPGELEWDTVPRTVLLETARALFELVRERHGA